MQTLQKLYLETTLLGAVAFQRSLTTEKSAAIIDLTSSCVGSFPVTDTGLTWQRCSKSSFVSCVSLS